MEERRAAEAEVAQCGGGDLRLPLRNLVQGLREVASQLREGESWKLEDFDLQFFWKTLGECVKAVSQEATKLSLAFSKPPLPSVQDCQKLTAEIQKSILTLSSVYYWLPKSQGLTLRRLVRDAAMDIVEGVIQLLNVILTTPLQSLSQDQLTSTGGVWEACDRFSKIPQDNHVAVLSLMSSYSAIVEDALEEMKQAQHTDNADPFSDIFEDDESHLRENRDTYWSEDDKQVMAPCLGLLKAAKACLKKVSAAVKNSRKSRHVANIVQLDDLGDVTSEISPSVDELVLSLYPPMNYITVQMNAAKVASVLNKALEITKSSHVCPESESNWLQFLSGAIDHNMDKVKDLTQGSS
ncbi:LOW QUALITY PROTEIN: cyclin-D1-binding protein 1 homolog [Pristis pectinata]|uniref:LOW QUALITY PROTEIN: cyclin-D1-binding protein 1 homolog n=1 Tax=Pristis pectinata TaxID=685728 RepID=UPI00223E0E10|nr:LOW QUALITY PROTEIN: cyclin-D1-binding protein 1 homolog [Pristis pectinata]